MSGPVKLCRVEEHQHQLAHQCSPNIIGIWEWGICGLMGGAFITQWVEHLCLTGLDIYDLMEGHLYHLMGGAFVT